MVDLLRANGVKVPVTLHMTTHDDGERVQHGAALAHCRRSADDRGDNAHRRVSEPLPAHSSRRACSLLGWACWAL